jgi:hypothetical protein
LEIALHVDVDGVTVVLIAKNRLQMSGEMLGFELSSQRDYSFNDEMSVISGLCLQGLRCLKTDFQLQTMTRAKEEKSLNRMFRRL